MTDAVLYRRLAGGILIWALLPLPFLYIIKPPFWLTGMAIGSLLVLRPGISVRLPSWAKNLLAIVIVLAVLAAGGIRVGPLRPLGQLLLLLASVRAFEVVDRRSFVRVLPPLFLVWLISLTASTHVAVLLYFAASAVLWWWVGMEVHLLGVVTARRGSRPPLVRARHAAAAGMAAMLLALPIFLAMPRLRSPFIAGRGGLQSVTGFSSRVQLSGVGSIRQSQRPALTVASPPGERLERSWTRLRATAFERVTVDSWAPRRADPEQVAVDGLLRPLGGDRSIEDAMPLQITLLRPDRYLFMPTAAVAVRTDVPVRVDPAGGLTLADAVEGPLEYTVWVESGEGPRRLDRPHTLGPGFAPDPDVELLARRITRGIEGSLERAAAVEEFLQSNYRYSLEGMARIGPDPVTWFLLRSRQGHCEYFAGGMVVLLDAVGVPARMVAGYSGGDVSPSGEEALVREANAHTWVEVWAGPERGWEVFDPTPAAGIPGFSEGRSRLRLGVGSQWIQASCDRYVLTYGLGEQLSLLEGIVDSVAALIRRIELRHVVEITLVLLVAWTAYRTARWRRMAARRGPRRGPAARAVEWVRGRLQRSGAPLPSSITVRGIGTAAAERWPQSEADLQWLVEQAERELYGSGSTAVQDRATRRVWRDLKGRLRESRRSAREA